MKTRKTLKTMLIALLALSLMIPVGTMGLSGDDQPIYTETTFPELADLRELLNKSNADAVETGGGTFEEFRAFFFKDFGAQSVQTAMAIAASAQTLFYPEEEDYDLYKRPLKGEGGSEPLTVQVVPASAALAAASLAEPTANHSGPFVLGDTRYFNEWLYDSDGSDLYIPVLARLVAQGEHGNVWVWDHEDYHAQYYAYTGTYFRTSNPATCGSQCFVYSRANNTTGHRQIADRFDGAFALVTDPVTGFAPFANVQFRSWRDESDHGLAKSWIGDLGDDGSVNIMFKDYSYYLTNEYNDMTVMKDGREVHPIDVINVSGTGAGLLAHEFQHLLWDMYLEAYEVDEGWGAYWLNETFSGYANLYYGSPGSETISRSSLTRAAANPYTWEDDYYKGGSLLHFDNDKGYGMAEFWSLLMSKKTEGTFAAKFYKALRSNASTLEEKLQFYGREEYGMDHYLGRAFKYALGDEFYKFTDKQVHDYLFYIFLESFAADGGTIVDQDGRSFSSPKFLDPAKHGATVAANNLWYLRTFPQSGWNGNNTPEYSPPTIISGGRVLLAGYGGFGSTSTRQRRLPLEPGTGFITYANGTLVGAHHEKFYRIGESPSVDKPALRIEIPDGPGLAGGFEYYVAVPVDTYEGVRPPQAGPNLYGNGATVYHLKKGQPNFVDVNGGVAYLYVITLYYDVDTTVEFSWAECVCEPGPREVAIAPTRYEKGLWEIRCGICGEVIQSGPIGELNITGAETSPANFVSIIETAKNSRVWELTFNALLTLADEDNMYVVTEKKEYKILLNGNNANLDGKFVFGPDHELVGMTLVYDIKGNGSNIKDLRLI